MLAFSSTDSRKCLAVPASALSVGILRTHEKIDRNAHEFQNPAITDLIQPAGVCSARTCATLRACQVYLPTHPWLNVSPRFAITTLLFTSPNMFATSAEPASRAIPLAGDYCFGREAPTTCEQNNRRCAKTAPPRSPQQQQFASFARQKRAEIRVG